MKHDDPQPHHGGDPDHHPAIVSRNARVGLALFAVYVLLYAGFMALNAFAPQRMSATFGGINLAVWYGLVLIVGAFVLALVYMTLVRRKGAGEGAPNGSTTREGGR